MVHPTSPTREEFIQAIHRFEETHHVELKDILVGRCWRGSHGMSAYLSDVETNMLTPEQASLRKEFFKDKVITGYLARPADQITFTAHHPDFSVDEANKENNDYYECLIYQLASQNQKTFFLPYRAEVLTDKFSLEGTLDCNIFYEKMSSVKSEIGIATPEDIYNIRGDITKISLLGSAPVPKDIEDKFGKTVFLLSPSSFQLC